MSFTYTPADSNISNSNVISAVRFALQDTVSDQAEFSDAEITAQVEEVDTDRSQKVQNLTVAVSLAWHLHRKYARMVSFGRGKTSLQATERARYWETIAHGLEDDLKLALSEDDEDGVGEGGVLFAGRLPGYWDDLAGGFGSLGGVLRG
jgi:hypothetical protein